MQAQAMLYESRGQASLLDEALGRTILLDSFVVELRIAATLDDETQRDILRRLDDSRFWRRVLPTIVRELHDSKMNEIHAVVVR